MDRKKPAIKYFKVFRRSCYVLRNGKSLRLMKASNHPLTKGRLKILPQASTQRERTFDKRQNTSFKGKTHSIREEKCDA